MSGFRAIGVMEGLSKACAALLFIAACGNSASGGERMEADTGTSAASPQGAGGSNSGNVSTGGAGVTSSGGAPGGSGATNEGNTTGGAGAANSGNAQGGGATNGGNTGGGGSGAGGSTIPECPGDWPEDSVECRSTEECADGLTCMFAVIPCGIRHAPVEGRCQTDEECGDQICELASEYNCPPTVRLCQARCTEDSCPEGWTCGENGRCEEIRCNEGYACPAGYGCMPEDASGYRHGCVPLSCTEGFECSNGWGCDPGAEGSNSLTGCRFLRCDEPGGAQCPLNFDCDPETASLLSGCVQRSCSSDDDCDCGFCNAGTCSTVGRCLVYQPQLCGCG